MIAVVKRISLSLGMRIVTSPDDVVRLRLQWPARQASWPAECKRRSAPTRSPGSSSSSPFGISSTVLRTSSRKSVFRDSSFEDTMGSGVVYLQSDRI